MMTPSHPFLYDTGYWRQVFQLNPASPSNTLENMPFTPGDAAAGVENELQTAVTGSSTTVDLPISIRESDFFRNMHKRIHSGESSGKPASELEKYLDDRHADVWENSWVRFPRQLLNSYAQRVLNTDLLSDKQRPESQPRSDVSRFVYSHCQEEWLRIPVSYLIKLSLADVIGRCGKKIPQIWSIGEKLMNHFLSDNTSPETYSFQPVQLSLTTGMGQASSRETLKRYLLTHLLVEYGNQQFQLRLNGQETQIYFAPHPTVIDTDTDTGTRVGCVAMIEVVAMMIGDIVQCYSETAYNNPKVVTPGMSLKKGQPKSLFRPGSSTTVLIFEKDRVRFSDDLWRNMFRRNVFSRFSQGFGMPLVETNVRVRSEIGRRPKDILA